MVEQGESKTGRGGMLNRLSLNRGRVSITEKR